MLPKCSTNTIKGHRVRATVGKGQTEANHAKDVPEVVVIFVGCWAENGILFNLIWISSIGSGSNLGIN